MRGTQSNRRALGCTYDWNPADNNALEQLFGGLQQLFVNFGVKNTPVVNIPPGGCISLTPPPEMNPSSVRNSLREKNLSWRTGLDYKTDGGTLLYASISRGYKAGIISLVAASSTSQYKPVKQERIDAFEVGFKAPLLDRRAHVNGAFFYYDYRNKQLRAKVFDPIFGLLEQLTNIPKSKIWGIQADIDAQPVDGLRLSVGGTYINSEVNGSFASINGQGNAGDFRGSDLPTTPKWSIVADGEYGFPINDRNNLFFGSSLTYRSKANSTFNSVAAPAPNMVLPSYALLDLRAGISASDDSWRLSVFGKNVTNKFYVLDVFQSIDNRYRTAGMGATYGVSLNLRWK